MTSLPPPCLPTALVKAFMALLTLTLTLAAVPARSATIRLMPLGDSITAGYRSSTGDGYRSALYGKLTNGNRLDFVGSGRDGVAYDTDHEGHSGYRIDQVAGLTTQAVKTYQPNIVTLLIGVNDLGQNYQVSTAPNRLAALIDQVLAAAPPGATVLVGQMIVNTTSAVQSRINAYNSQIPGIVQARVNAGKHVAVVNTSAVTTADLADGLRPNDSGYRKLADAWATGVQNAINAGWVTNLDFAGSYELQLVSSEQSVDVSGGAMTNNAPIVQWPRSGGRNQVWNFIPTSGGYYQLKSAGSGLDINVSAASNTPGASVVQWRFGAEGNDQWLPKRNSDGSWVFQNRKSGLVLTNNGGQGAQFVQDTDRGGAHQRFSVFPR